MVEERQEWPENVAGLMYFLFRRHHQYVIPAVPVNSFRVVLPNRRRD